MQCDQCVKTVSWRFFLAATALGIFIVFLVARTASQQSSGVQLLASSADSSPLTHEIWVPTRPNSGASWVPSFNSGPDAFWPPWENVTDWVGTSCKSECHGSLETIAPDRLTSTCCFSWRNSAYDWANNTGVLDSGGHRYPISPAQFERAFTPPDAAMRCLWERVATGLEAGLPVRIAVLGGSMTGEHRTPGGNTGWPTFLNHWLGTVSRARGFNISIEVFSGGQVARNHARDVCPRVSAYPLTCVSHVCLRVCSIRA